MGKKRVDSGAWAVGVWNALVPPGSEVIVRRDDGEAEGGVTRSVAWQLGDGTPVVKIEGKPGGYLLWRVEPSNRLLWQLGHSVPVMEAERDELLERVNGAAAELAGALRRQAQQWCRAHEDGEGPPLEALLALVPGDVELIVTIRGDGRRACWWPCTVSSGTQDPIVSADGFGWTAAIRAATLKLLGVEQQPEGPGLPGVTVAGNVVAAAPVEKDDDGE